MQKTSLRTIVFLAVFAMATSFTLAAQDMVSAPAVPVVPHIIKYSGSLPNAPASASEVEVKFALYAAQTGGDPLWTETQQVALDSQSRYAVLLGAATPNGLPDALFAAGAAKWLGVTLSGGTEAPRTLLSANAYALKANDAETLAGHPVTDFKLANNANGKPDATGITTIDAGSGITVTDPTGPTTTIGLNVSYLTTLGNSAYAQLAAANKFTGNQSISGNLLSSGTFTTLTGASKLAAGGAVDITYANGVYTFALDAAAGQAFGNTYWAQLAASVNTFTGIGIFDNYVEGHEAVGPGNAGALGFGTNGSIGTYGDSDTGYGVQGASASGQGVVGEVTTPVQGTEGVLGYTGTAFSTTYTAEAGVAYAGVWADSSSSGLSGIGLGLFATSDSGYGGAFVNDSADFPALFVDNNSGTGATFSAGTGDGIDASSSSGSGIVGTAEGAGNGVVGNADAPSAGLAGVKGVSATASVEGGAYNIFGAVWGDTGTSSTSISPAWAIGVLGTADDSHAGVFLNNSTNGWSTMYVSNAGTGGTGLSTPALFDTIMAVSKNGTCGIGSGSLSCTGQIKSLVSAGGSRTVETYAMQSPENWMEDFGSGSLAHGKAVINLDPAFAETISRDGSYHVFLTPNGDSKGLYVSAKTASSFEVRESGGGTSSLSFDYRIVAKRLGYEAQRLTDVTDTLARESARETMARSTVVRKPTAARKVSPLEQALKTPHRTIVPSRTPRNQVAPHPVATSKHEVASR